MGKGRGCRKLVYECANICAFYCHQRRLETRSETRTGAQPVIKMGNCCQVWSAEGGGGSCRVAGANKTTLPAMWQVCLGYPGCAASSSPVCLLAKSVSATAAKGALRPRSMAQHGTWPCPDDAISAQARLVNGKLSSSSSSGSWHWGPALGPGEGATARGCNRVFPK